GVFYTPIRIVDEILEATLGQSIGSKTTSELFQIRIVDPACGAGIFLIRALRMLMRELARRGEQSARHAAVLAQECLHGVDCDESAGALAKELIANCAAQYGAELHGEDLKHIRIGNSLIDPQTLPGRTIPTTLQPFAWSVQYPEVFKMGGFDFVVGNPPYGLSRDEQISAAENMLLQQAFASSRNGKINKYLAFIALGFRLLRTGGALSYIVPNAWLGIKSAAKLRSLLLEERALEAITVYDFPVFNDPSVEAVVFKLRKSRPSERITILHRKSYEQSGPVRLMPIEECLADPQRRISILWDENLSPIIKILRSHALTLGSLTSPFVPMIALQAYAEGKGDPPQRKEQVKSHCFHHTSKVDAHTYPYFEGSDIGRYALRWSGAYLQYGKFLAEAQSIERFKGPRVLLREILNPSPYVLAASYTEEAALYNKSVLHILAKEKVEPELMLALCALLNSKLISFFVRMCGCKSQRRLFPKIVNDDLKSIPLSKGFFGAAAELAQRAEQQMRQVSAERDREIDALIFAAYAISESQAERVCSFLESEQ
ncbi:MAG: N-6 DNA methylase, partial [Deltaproteobacteria bacterium]|nr:N-6 DNA methylase [Deltaproteobacteria bacterium]